MQLAAPTMLIFIPETVLLYLQLPVVLFQRHLELTVCFLMGCLRTCGVPATYEALKRACWYAEKIALTLLKVLLLSSETFATDTLAYHWVAPYQSLFGWRLPYLFCAGSQSA